MSFFTKKAFAGSGDDESFAAPPSKASKGKKQAGTPEQRNAARAQISKVLGPAAATKQASKSPKPAQKMAKGGSMDVRKWEIEGTCGAWLRDATHRRRPESMLFQVRPL